MAHQSGQTSVQKAMEITPDGTQGYHLQLPHSLCFADVVFGGLIASIVHKASLDFVSRNEQYKTWPDVLSQHTQYFRPLLSHPTPTDLVFRLVNSSRTSTILHFDVTQGYKVCVHGIITLGSLDTKAGLTATTGWQLLPPPPEVNLHELETDSSSSWSGYLTPFATNSYRKPQAYVRYFVPVQRSQTHYMDQWVEPVWPDTDGPVVWTNETVHFIIDNALPIINDIIGSKQGPSLYQKIVQAGLAQKEARLRNESDYLWGEGLRDEQMKFPWILSTVSSTTQIKRLLPAAGCRWLSMRETVKSIDGSRMDLEIHLMNEDMKLVALSQHMCQIIPVMGKKARKSTL